jgi:A/G-specific adenine glycosylase
MNTRFADRLLIWFDRHGRHDLPWQHPRTPYRVWISEIMLQQTQVATVIGYFERFMRTFPDMPSLAAAPLDAVLAQWAGLGYYSRARNLHRAAAICATDHAGDLPRDMQSLCALPGIGRSTAAAILSQAYAERVAILDGNVKRVLARHAGIEGYPGLPAIERMLWTEAESRLPDSALQARMPDYTQALMDLGAGLCVRSKPRCSECPLRTDCIAYQTERTAELPTRKAPRAIPEKFVQVLIALDEGGRVLLLRRAPVGIWGGLWSLPELTPMMTAPADTTVATESLQSLPIVQHRFTHFLLNIHPFATHSALAITHVNEQPERAWVNRNEFDQYGMPAPIRKLLRAIAR